MNILISLLIFPAKSEFYTETQINTLCADGNADTDPPSLSPGKTTMKRIKKFKSKIFLNSYYNDDDHSLTANDRLLYTEDLLPYSFLLYFSFLTTLVWIMYISCIICKCCYCLISPATRVQSRREKLFPLILMAIVIACLITFSAFALFYISQLQGSIGYLVCVAARWSGGYFYGYDNWKGIHTIDNSTKELISFISSKAEYINSTLIDYHNQEILNVSQDMQFLFNNFVNTWKSIKNIENPNFPSYSNELPFAYNCTLCKKLYEFEDSFKDDVEKDIEPLSQDLTMVIEEVYEVFLERKEEIENGIREKYEWTEKLTQLYIMYEEKNLKFFDDLNSIKDGMYGNTLFLISCTVLMMFFQAFASIMVYLKRYNWRKWLHIGWCCYSILMIFLFTISGLLFISSLVLSEGCTVFSSIIQENKVGSIFYSNGSSAIDFCHNEDGDLASFLNLTSEFSFVSSLINSTSKPLSTNFSPSYQISTLDSLEVLIQSSDVESFISTSNNSIHWNGAKDVNFFLFKSENLPYSQNKYLNDFTIYIEQSQQYESCNLLISMDYWAFNKTFCETGYKYQYALDATSSSEKKCYIMSQEHTYEGVKERYVDRRLFGNCDKINSTDFETYIMKYWAWANDAYLLNKGFEEILRNISLDFDETSVKIYDLIEKIYNYYEAVGLTQDSLEEVQTRISLYYSSMNCSLVKDLTAQFYLGFCGEILDFMFFVSIYVSALAFCNFFLSLSVVLILFRYRTDLEIEQERVVRRIGMDSCKADDVTERVDETIINKNNI